ncbi:hypothetical protein KHS38_04420 [Mucilaginibacter sp. Bleaf8]|uniref:Mut7-C RNAse domain-containing protein n=1 Tax=Mucilaginibacter sp. Bleaf8 TaxID=2834430 RepID=UPI001BCB451C|nr:Mut7-C RNAse domain-containing protein [Mucilaginibacter sp. Bleaf8]MBS7563641.1 hypothetical protein [Mucilaginibacter sp. Bleaf8]
MEHKANFTFKGSLGDILPITVTPCQHDYYFNGKPSVKDAIEAMGIPHTEVDVVLVNGNAVDFQYLLQNHDTIEAYPHGSSLSSNYSISGSAPVQNGFIVDAHLGTLARMLRLLGFDAWYDNRYTEAVIAPLAASENRIVLTRSAHLLKHKDIKWGHYICSPNTEEQIGDVMSRFDLSRNLQPFKRCMVCNGLLQPVPKQQVAHQLQPKTREYFNEFWQCDHCWRVYWKGSHYEKMLLLIDKLRNVHAGE